jgi:NAD(P)-dependent dehydrogenase (short-subunit alcohol dehydrogenase family)
MAVRDVERGAQARDELLRAHPRGRLQLERLDLCDLASVRALAARPFDVDVVVNNAGLAFEPKRLTREGVLSQFAANHLGHFALTALLYERLARREDPRVVTVTSTLAKKGSLDLGNLDGSQGFAATRAYTQSKLANVLFGAELARRTSKVKSVLAHPGVPATPMQQKAQGLIGVVVRMAARLVGKPPEHGATALLEAALGESVQSGELLGPGRRLGDPPRRESPWPSMGDRTGAAALWDRSETLAQVRFLSSAPFT